MRLPELAIRNRTFTLFAVFLVVVAGAAAFFSLGQLEEPDFTIKIAVVSTPYPGATPSEVERDVTDRIETKLQELRQVDYLVSSSQEGLSTVKVFIKPSYSSPEMPQVWDELRRKVNDVAPQLPKGAGPSAVSDDFGDVYGLLLAITGDGYSTAELGTYATDLKTRAEPRAGAWLGWRCGASRTGASTLTPAYRSCPSSAFLKQAWSGPSRSKAPSQQQVPLRWPASACRSPHPVSFPLRNPSPTYSSRPRRLRAIQTTGSAQRAGRPHPDR